MITEDQIPWISRTDDNMHETLTARPYEENDIYLLMRPSVFRAFVRIVGQLKAKAVSRRSVISDPVRWILCK